MLIPLLLLGAGILAGWLFPVITQVGDLQAIHTIALIILVFATGIGIGSQRTLWKRLRSIGAKALLTPLGTLFGSVAAGIGAGLLLGLSANEAGAVSAGMGYYSVSMAVLTDLGNAQLGALAFVTNILREVFSLLLIPLIARKLPYVCAIAPGGATAMDTTLPVISRCTDEETAVAAVVSGVILTGIVPPLVALLYGGL
ncbi:lysine exporter LysO family protein [Oscillospiraceae bacterium MB08-C2-2]|nr:lysine exporter LysO family protein [Oscillospiraceae bacterium MB08-C2-2]